MIPFSMPTYFGNEVNYVKDAVESTWISGGKYVELLTEFFSNFFDRKVTLTSNGTSAIQLAFLVLNIKAGDEIIVPAYGFQAAANVAVQMGIKPVFVDLESDFYYTSPEKIESKITGKTKAIVLIHNYGFVDDVLKYKKFNLPIIEDCAEAIFSKDVNNNYCGTLGDVSTFSFHATKTFTTGEGGMLMTNSPVLHTGANLYQSHGLLQRGTYNHIVPGNNFRMSNIHAALGVAQSEHVEDIIKRKKQLMDLYCDKLELKRYMQTILWSFPATVRYPGIDVYSIHELLRKAGVETRKGFVPANKLIYFSSDESFPNSQWIYDRTLILPLHLSLKDEDVELICDTIKEYYERKK